MKRICSWFLTIVLVLGLCACGQQGGGAGGDDWQSQYDLGVRYLSEGNYEEAVIAFTEAIEIDPNRPEAYVSLADAYIGLGDYESARAVLEDALEQAEDVEAVREKLEEVEELMGQAEDAPPEGAAEDGQSQDQEPEDPAGEAGEPEDAPEEGAETPSQEEPSEGAEQEETAPEEPEQEEPEGDTPEEEQTQLPDSYTTYQYAVDVVGNATVWDLYMGLEETTGYVFNGFSVYYQIIYMDYHAASSESDYLSFQSYNLPADIGSVLDQLEVLPEDSPSITEEILRMSDRCVVEYISGRYNPTGLSISPEFGDGLTYDEIVRICEENGYSYTMREDGAYYETYLAIEIGGGRTLTFAWEGFEIADIGGMIPFYFTLY